MIRRVSRWVDRHASVIALLVALTVGLANYIGVRAEARERAESDAQRPGEICAAFELQQEITRALIDVVLEPSGGGLPLLAPPSYAELPTSVQTYLDELLIAAADQRESGSTLADRLARFRDERLGDDDLPAYCLTGKGE